MTKENCWDSVNSTCSVIKNYMKKTINIKTNTDISKSNALSQLRELENGIRTSLFSAFGKLIKNVSEYGVQLKKKEEEEQTAYIPKYDTDKLLFYQVKQDIRRQIERMNYQEQIDFYEKLLSFVDLERIEMFEQEVMLLPDSVENKKLLLYVERVRGSRVKQQTREDLKDLLHLEGLSRTADRGLQDLKSGSTLQASILYAFLNLAGQSDISTFEEVKKTFNVRYAGVKL